MHPNENKWPLKLFENSYQFLYIISNLLVIRPVLHFLVHFGDKLMVYLVEIVHLVEDGCDVFQGDHWSWVHGWCSEERFSLEKTVQIHLNRILCVCEPETLLLSSHFKDPVLLTRDKKALLYIDPWLQSNIENEIFLFISLFASIPLIMYMLLILH